MASTHGIKFAIAPPFYWANEAEREPCVVTHTLASTLQSTHSAMVEVNDSALCCPFLHYPVPNHSPEWQSWGWGECSILVCEDISHLACSYSTYQASSLVPFSLATQHRLQGLVLKTWTFPKTNVRQTELLPVLRNVILQFQDKINY